MINLLIADDHPIMSQGLKLIFEDVGNVNVTGAVTNGKELVEYLENPEQEVDIVLVDIQMPVMNGLEASEYIIKSKGLDTKIILYSMRVDEAIVAKAIKIGVNGYLDKGCMGEEIYEAIKEVENGKIYYSEEVKKKLEKAKILIKNAPSPRQQEVIQEVDKGLKDEEIANSLNIGVETVRDHIKNLRKKFEVNNRTELLHVLRKKGLIQ